MKQKVDFERFAIQKKQETTEEFKESLAGMILTGNITFAYIQRLKRATNS